MSTRLLFILTLTVETPAAAFECLGANPVCPNPCEPPPGSSKQFEFVNLQQQFSPAQEDAIAEAAAIWNAGPGLIQRGALWEFEEGPGSCTTVSDSDGDICVVLEDDTFFQSVGLPGESAFARYRRHPWPICNWKDGDIFFNSLYTWSTEMPDTNPPGTVSLAIAAHEFGHVLSLAHPSSAKSVMFNAGLVDHGRELRTTTDDGLALRTLKPGSNQGLNLSLSKFAAWPDLGNNVEESWGSLEDLDMLDGVDDERVSVCPGHEASGDDRPSALMVSLVGTASSVSNLKIRYFLREDGSGACGGVGSIPIETVTFSVTNQTPSFPQPFDWTFDFNLPPGRYRLCAHLDFDNTVSETSEFDDNRLIGDSYVTIRAPNDPECQ